MRASFPIALVAAVLLGAVSGAACKKERKPSATSPPPPITVAEAVRAREACRSYQEKACALAEEDPALATGCQQAPARIEAIDLQVRTLRAAEGDMEEEERRVVQAQVRKVVKGCIEDLARLKKRKPGAGR